MNLLTTYEQTIASRRDGIEVPDMADAIWGRIEAVLDVEMPEPVTPAPVQEKPFFKKPAVWIISAGILAIIIALFILLRKEKTIPPPGALPQPVVPAVQPDTILRQELKPPGEPSQPAPKKNTKTIIETRIPDTVTYNPFVIVKDPVLQDAPVIKAPPAHITVPPIDIKPRPKYGVEVPDSEYLFKVKPKQ